MALGLLELLRVLEHHRQVAERAGQRRMIAPQSLAQHPHGFPVQRNGERIVGAFVM
jgi:hypothetical protein